MKRTRKKKEKGSRARKEAKVEEGRRQFAEDEEKMEMKAFAILKALKTPESKTMDLYDDLECSVLWMTVRIERWCRYIQGDGCRRIEDLEPLKSPDEILRVMNIPKGEVGFRMLVDGIQHYAMFKVLVAINRPRHNLVRALPSLKQWCKEIIAVPARKILEGYSEIRNLDLKTRQRRWEEAADSISSAALQALKDTGTACEDLKQEILCSEFHSEVPSSDNVEAILVDFAHAVDKLLDKDLWREQNFDIVQPHMQRVYELAFSTSLNSVAEWVDTFHVLVDSVEKLRKETDIALKEIEECEDFKIDKKPSRGMLGSLS
jgi:hypothetical protein